VLEHIPELSAALGRPLIAWASGFQEGHSLSIRADKKLIYYVKVQADNVDTENYELAVRS
jgi:hypothetical protein